MLKLKSIKKDNIMAGIGDYEKGKAFSLKSGNKPSFKKMGSSPAKDRKKWALEAHRSETAAHNALEATPSHHGDPHGPDPTVKPPKMTDDEKKMHRKGVSTDTP